MDGDTLFFGAIIGYLSPAAATAIGPFAPPSIHARSAATSAMPGAGFPFGGIRGFAVPSTIRIIGLSDALPATNAKPRLPPALNFAKSVITRSPFASSGVWQPKQYFARMGRT